MKRLLKLGQITFTNAIGLALIEMTALWHILYCYQAEVFLILKDLQISKVFDIKQAF